MFSRSASLIAVSVVVVAGCGGGNTSTGGKVHRIELRNTPSFESAKTACGAVPQATLARTLDVSSTDPVSIARAYAEKHAPLAARQDVYQGCYAGLTKP